MLVNRFSCKTAADVFISVVDVDPAPVFLLNKVVKQFATSAEAYWCRLGEVSGSGCPLKGSFHSLYWAIPLQRPRLCGVLFF